MKTRFMFLCAAVSLLICVGFAKVPEAKPKITITDLGVGGINKETPFDKNAIQKLFPSISVQAGVSSTEGEEFPILKVGDLLVINPLNDHAHIFSVEIKSNQVKNSFGPPIGATFKEIFHLNVAYHCSPGMEEMSGFVMCQEPSSKNIGYLFSGSWDGGDGQVPPREVLNSWTVKEIFWKPNGF